MNRSKEVLLMVAVVFTTLLVLCPVVLVRAQDKGEIKRKLLNKHDLTSVPGHDGFLGQVELAPGAAEGRHTHPGDLLGYVQQGTLTLNIEGKQATTVKEGESFFVPANAIHWGINEGKEPVKVLAAMVLEKDKPATSPAK